MKDDNHWAGILLVILIIWFVVDHHKLKNRIEELQDEVSSYEYALDQTNMIIDDAQSYAWGTYEEMGEALDNLETVQP